MNTVYQLMTASQISLLVLQSVGCLKLQVCNYITSCGIHYTCELLTMKL